MFASAFFPDDPVRLAVLGIAFMILGTLLLLTIHDELFRYRGKRKRNALKRKRVKRRVVAHPFFRTRRSMTDRLRDRLASLRSLMGAGLLGRSLESVRKWGKKYIYNGEITMHTVTDKRTGWTTQVYCEEPAMLELLWRKYFGTDTHITTLHEVKKRHKKETKSRFDYSHYVCGDLASREPVGVPKGNAVEYQHQINSEEEYYHGDSLRISSLERYGETPQEEVNKLLFEYNSFDITTRR